MTGKRSSEEDNDPESPKKKRLKSQKKLKKKAKKMVDMEAAKEKEAKERADKVGSKSEDSGPVSSLKHGRYFVGFKATQAQCSTCITTGGRSMIL